jgi:hypothetical protein
VEQVAVVKLVSKVQLVEQVAAVKLVSKVQLVEQVAVVDKVQQEQLDWLVQVVQDLPVQQPLQYQVSLDSIMVYLMILDILHGAG